MEEFRQEISLMQQKRKKFRALQRFSYVAMFDKNGVSDAFNLAKIVMTYLNILFHLDILKLYSMIKVMKYNKDDFLILLRTLGNLEAYDSIA